MQKKIVLIQSRPTMARVSDEEYKNEIAKSIFLSQLVGDLTEIDTLLNEACEVVSAPDKQDYYVEIPELMGQLYTYSLRLNFARRQLMDSATFSGELLDALPSICRTHYTVTKFLNLLEDIYEEQVGFDDSEDEEESCEEGECEEDGEEMGEDSLCEVTIQYAEGVSERTIDLIAAGIHGVITAHLGDVEIAREREKDSGCGSCCSQEG